MDLKVKELEGRVPLNKSTAKSQKDKGNKKVQIKKFNME